MPARKKSGFTLIELLVVIAIIAILAAILFPVFARAREAARKSTCQSNMKECAIALQTYWNDYDATLPCSVPANNGAITDAGYPLFGTLVGSLTPLPATPRTWPEMLYNSMKNRDIMFCPSDSSDHNITSSKISYFWKFAIDKAWRDQTMRCQKEGDFGYNADQIVFYERAGFHSGGQAGLRNDVQINCAFLDSHVKSVSIVNSSAGATATPIDTNVADPMFTGEPNYFNFDNNQVKSASNPPPTATAVTWYDPRQYSDLLP